MTIKSLTKVYHNKGDINFWQTGIQSRNNAFYWLNSTIHEESIIMIMFYAFNNKAKTVKKQKKIFEKYKSSVF